MKQKENNMDLIPCPECNHKILSKLGTVCPKCGFTLGFFNGEEKRKRYGKFFALSVAIPFINLIIILATSLNKFTLIFGFFIYISLAYISFPYRFKDIFNKTFEKIFFYTIWFIANSILTLALINLLLKNFNF